VRHNFHDKKGIGGFDMGHQQPSELICSVGGGNHARLFYEVPPLQGVTSQGYKERTVIAPPVSQREGDQ
jgi:hypothetical protein